MRSVRWFLIYEVCEWKVRPSNSKRHLKALIVLRNLVKANRMSFFYQRSRYFTVDVEDSKLETWISFDEYKDQLQYDKMFKGYRSKGRVYVEFAKLMESWEPLIVPDSLKVETWVERPEMTL